MTEVTKLQTSTTNLTNYISQLSTIEDQLHTQLVQTTDQGQQKQITQTLNVISGVKDSLNQTLIGINTYYNNNLNSASLTLSQQTDAVAIIDKEMEVAKQRLMYINEQKENKLRIVEINDYYGSAYAEYTTLMKIIILVVLPVLILTILIKKDIINSYFYNWSLLIIFILGFYFVMKTLLSIWSRDTMNYQEYNWYFNKNSAPKISGNATFTNPFALPSITCVGQMCCDAGYTYNVDANKCLPTGATYTTTADLAAAAATTSTGNNVASNASSVIPSSNNNSSISSMLDTFLQSS